MPVSISTDPREWRDTIWSITNVFETGRPEGNASAVQTFDAGIVSYGKHQATLATSALQTVLTKYFARSDSNTSKALEKFMPRVRRKDKSLRNDETFLQLLRDAGREKAMHKAQDEVFLPRFVAAIREAQADGIKTPLGIACAYDTFTQGGGQHISNTVVKRIGKVNSLVDEKLWISTYLLERERWLYDIAQRKADKGDHANAKALRISTFRVRELRRLLDQNNLNLTGIFNVRGRRIAGIDQQQDDEQLLKEGLNDAEAAGFNSDYELREALTGGTKVRVFWTFKNTGESGWSEGYTLAHTSAEHPETADIPNTVMGSPKNSYDVSDIGAMELIAPGDSVTLEVDFVAPNEKGLHASHWQLVDPDGEPFGPVRWVRVEVGRVETEPEDEEEDDTPITPPFKEVDALKVLAFKNSGNFKRMDPGTAFKVTWSLKNNGTSVWTPDFHFAYLHTTVPDTINYTPARMTKRAHYSFKSMGVTEDVQPGGVVEVSLDMAAPPLAGTYASHWQVRDETGMPFGGTRFTWVRVVGATSHPIRPPVRPQPDRYTGPKWQFDHMLNGIHDRAGRHPMRRDFEVAGGKFESIKVQTGVTVEEMRGYRPTENFYFCRLFHSWGGRFQTVGNFLDSVMPDMDRLVHAGVTYFEFHNEPNLTSEGMKMHEFNGSWSNGAEFAEFFIAGRDVLKKRYPQIKVGFPGLSPGGDARYSFGHDSGMRYDANRFLREAKKGIDAADFMCLHAYYINESEARGTAIDWVKQHRRAYQNKLLFVTEYSNPDSTTNGPNKGKQARIFVNELNKIPGIGAAYYFIVSGGSWDHQSLRRSDGSDTGFLSQFIK